MTAEEKRKSVANKYKTILGRNRYSQTKRSFVYKKASDGKYYSDCSSSIAATYQEVGIPVRDNSGYALPNTVGMYTSNDLVDVPVKIRSDGTIQNPEVLRVGDLLLFAGNDQSRKYAGFVGHVEMIYSISGSRITICGHGSGTPRTTEMNGYCRSRRNQKASTDLGHRGLIRVRRRIADDNVNGNGGNGMKKVIVTGNTVNVRSGPGTQYKVLKIAKLGEEYPYVATAEANGWPAIEIGGEIGWISNKYAQIKE